MKILFKKVLIALVIVSMLLLPSCKSDDKTPDKEFEITCVFGDGRENEILTVASGGTLTLNPPKREGYEFVGWCTDSTLANFYDFTNDIISNITLYAKWDIDYKVLLDDVSQNASESCVKVISSSLFGLNSQGSGVIYKKDSDYYYVLTNNHVITSTSGALKKTHVIYDAYGNEYVGTVVKNDPKYDLAVLKFAISDDVELKTAEILNRLPSENERVVTVSARNGQYNTVAIGDVAWYSSVDTSTGSGDKSEVDFEVLWIDGTADHGSSGGAVFDKELNVIGVIYATVELTKTEESFVLAIPAPKILEFLSDINYTE